VEASEHARERDGVHTVDVEPVAAGAADGSLVVVVERLDGPDAVRAVESALKTGTSKRE
jgi:hypothetical protein